MIRRRGTHVTACAFLLVLFAAVPAIGGPQHRAPATPFSPTGTFADGSVLPSGRLVTPAGTTVNLGDFPLGVAVSPDGRLVAAVNSGDGTGLNSGFNSSCGQGQNLGDPPRQPPCPYYANDPRAKAQTGDPAERTYDESLTVLDTVTGSTRTLEAHPTVYDSSDPSQPLNPAHFNFFYVGVTFSPDGHHLYASGGGNNAVYDFAVNGATVAPAPSRVLTLPQPYVASCSSWPGPAALAPNFPVFGCGNGFTKGMTTTPDGRWLLVAHEFNNTLDIVDTTTFAVSQEVVLGLDPTPLGGFYPYSVAVSPDGGAAYVSGQGLGVVAVVKLSGGHGTTTRLVSVGDHPTALAVSPDGSQVYVANADSDDLSIVDTSTGTVASSVPLHAFPGEQLGSTPNAVAVSPDGSRVYVALAGDDGVAVLGTEASFRGTGSGATGGGPSSPDAVQQPAGVQGLPNTAAPASPAPADWVVGGMIPAGWYPSGVAVAPDGGRVYIADAKGLGSRYVAPLDGGEVRDGALRSTFEYDGNNMPGLLQVVRAPSGSDLAAGLATVQRDILFATSGDATRASHNPVPARQGDPSPITHVIEVVRENRTFDQVLGDLTDSGHEQRSSGLGPAQVDSFAPYTLFGRDITPNAHALVGDPLPGHPDPAFATSDNFYSDGEASVQGHWWTTAANVNDYVEKAWRQYYSPRNHFYDPESTISQPRNCTIFQSAFMKSLSDPSFTFRNYGELIGLSNIDVPGVNAGRAGPSDLPNPCSAHLNVANDDPRAIQDENLDVDNRATATEFLSDIGLNTDGSATGRPGDVLRNFSYITLSGDHTGGLSFNETPRSRVAENDAGLGLIVQALSHSTYWSSTAILVMEDDSQDGLDHEDGHRNLLYAISPYARHTGDDGKGGYISHHHYSQASVLKTIELILGLPFLSTYDEYASPLDDLFQDKASASELTTSDLQPYSVQPVASFVPESTRCYGNAAAPATACPSTAGGGTTLAADLLQRSGALDLSAMDLASPDLEVIAWQLGHPDESVPAQLDDEMAAWKIRRDAGAAQGGDG